ncbi:MAG: FAD/NAD(P)-binding protein [Desulfovibrionaceae bacterium]|jgi:NAD(P)H-flavin reductase|nr:FAD/NAD(P)-binding protein [Desulfovibrionaceae bacterium]
MSKRANPYLPQPGTIIDVVEETPAIKTFRVVLDDPEAMLDFRFLPGQVAQLSVFGAGEATFVINSPPTRMEYLQFTVLRTGEVTARLHALGVGDHVGVRGPLGNHFPVAQLRGRDLLFVGGGIGMAPLRTLLLYVLDNRADFGHLALLYGARTPQDFCFGEELATWGARRDIDVVRTVDAPAEGWDGRVGLVPHVLEELRPTAEGCTAVTCGPPVMIRFTVQALEKLGFGPERIVTTLERRMKCGVGLCGRCNIGSVLVCRDGPVFTKAELDLLPNDY